jgi:hypothetical protein
MRTTREQKKAVHSDSEPEEPLGVRGVGSSNLPVPTIRFPLFFRFFPLFRRLPFRQL